MNSMNELKEAKSHTIMYPEQKNKGNGNKNMH